MQPKKNLDYHTVE